MEGRCPNPNTLDALFHVEGNTTPGEHMESCRVRPCRRLSGIRSVEETVGMEEEEAEDPSRRLCPDEGVKQETWTRCSRRFLTSDS